MQPDQVAGSKVSQGAGDRFTRCSDALTDFPVSQRASDLDTIPCSLAQFAPLQQ
jgi:hypothetical protein